jgi:hypothetical protein
MQVIANISSILGFVISVFILLYSMSVKKAVQAAKKDMKTRIERDDLISDMKNIISEFENASAFLTGGKVEISKYLVENGLKDLGYFTERWKKYILEHSSEIWRCHRHFDRVRSELASLNPDVKKIGYLQIEAIELLSRQEGILRRTHIGGLK